MPCSPVRTWGVEVRVVTVSMRLVSAGDGVRYFFESVVAGDGDRDLATPLTRYYSEQGCPPVGGSGRASHVWARESASVGR